MDPVALPFSDKTSTLVPHSFRKESTLGSEFLGRYGGVVVQVRRCMCHRLPRSVTLTVDRSLFDRAMRKQALVSMPKEQRRGQCHHSICWVLLTQHLAALGEGFRCLTLSNLGVSVKYSQHPCLALRETEARSHMLTSPSSQSHRGDCSQSSSRDCPQV